MAKKGISLDVIGEKELIKQLNNLSPELMKIIDHETRASADDIVENAKKLAPTDRGFLHNNIFHEPLKDSKESVTYSIIANAEYAAFVEFGTGSKVQVPAELQDQANNAKRVKGSFKEGLENIKGWCRRKGIDESAAYVIFMSILKKGISPKPFMYPAFVAERKLYIKRISKMLKTAIKK